MKKKLVILGISAVLMLVTISFASAINTNTATTIEKTESPLYKIRTSLAIKEKIGQILENIKTRFIGERLFFIPFRLDRIREKNIIIRDHFLGKCGPIGFTEVSNCHWTDLAHIETCNPFNCPWTSD